jgi:hypothetical protein
MKKSHLIFVVILLGLTQFSCKKDEQSLSKKDMLTNNTWIITSKALSPVVSFNGLPINDVSILDSDDQKNFTFKYNSDGTMIEYNKLKQEIFRTKWSFNADETQLIHNPGITYSYQAIGDFTISAIVIESITAKKIVAKIPYSMAGTVYTTTFVYEPK